MKNKVFKFKNYRLITKQRRLASIVERFTDNDGIHETSIPALEFVRISNISEPIHSLYAPSLCIIVQGAKTVILGGESYRYDVNSYLVSSVHLPVVGQITEASLDAPYLCIRLSFSPDQILDIVKESNQLPNQKSDLERGLFVTEADSELLDALLRLVKLLDTPSDIPILAPLFTREILYRVLQDKHGDIIKQFAVIGSHAQNISKAITMIKNDFAMPLRIDELAKIINMSPSSLHYHFKIVTGMSPMQYQKNIRLQEARRLLLSDTLEASDAGFKVGYDSPSQFSREYARMFGLPPISDIKRLKGTI